jgi:hypothetical protein
VSDITIDRLFPLLITAFLIGFLKIGMFGAGFILNMGLFCAGLRWFALVCVLRPFMLDY